MGKYDKFLIKILRGTSDANILFSELCNLMKVFGFDVILKYKLNLGGNDE